MPAQQSSSSHTRFDPLFHFFLGPIFLINLILTISVAIHDGRFHLGLHLWAILLALALLALTGMVRAYALKNQDRLIRLEERLRLTTLLPAADAPLIHSLTIRQFVALRFASDAELPTLARRALAETLTPKQIKQSIVTWRADYERI